MNTEEKNFEENIISPDSDKESKTEKQEKIFVQYPEKMPKNKNQRENIFIKPIRWILSILGKAFSYLAGFLVLMIALSLIAPKEGKSSFVERKIIACFDPEIENYTRKEGKNREGFCNNKSNLERIAIIRIDGIIDTEDSKGNGITNVSTKSIDSIKRQLKIAAGDSSVKAIILRINSGGGTVLASNELFREIENINKKKKVVAYIENFGASGAYMASLGANEIYANKNSMVGSIGTIIQFINFSDLLDNLGIKYKTIKSGELKDAGSSFSKEDKSEEVYRSMVEETSKDFFDLVLEKRGSKISDENFQKIKSGQIFLATEAKKIGLVDDLMSLDELLEKLREDEEIEKKKFEVFEYQENLSLLQQILLSVKNINISIFGINIEKVQQTQNNNPSIKLLHLWDDLI
mgnify:CR=1 FL=1